MCVNNNLSNFSYNEFSKQLAIKNASDAVFEFAMWSYPCFDAVGGVDDRYKSYFINKLKNIVLHLVKTVDRYACRCSNDLDVAIEIFNKTDVKALYGKSVNGIVDGNSMKTYMKTKTFINNIRTYITSKLYDVCFVRGYTKETCKEIDKEILNDLTNIFYGC